MSDVITNASEAQAGAIMMTTCFSINSPKHQRPKQCPTAIRTLLHDEERIMNWPSLRGSLCSRSQSTWLYFRDYRRCYIIFVTFVYIDWLVSQISLNFAQSHRGLNTTFLWVYYYCDRALQWSKPWIRADLQLYWDSKRDNRRTLRISVCNRRSSAIESPWHIMAPAESCFSSLRIEVKSFQRPYCSLRRSDQEIVGEKYSRQRKWRLNVIEACQKFPKMRNDNTTDLWGSWDQSVPEWECLAFICCSSNLRRGSA